MAGVRNTMYAVAKWNSSIYKDGHLKLEHLY